MKKSLKIIFLCILILLSIGFIYLIVKSSKKEEILIHEYYIPANVKTASVVRIKDFSFDPNNDFKIESPKKFSSESFDSVYVNVKDNPFHVGACPDIYVYYLGFCNNQKWFYSEKQEIKKPKFIRKYDLKSHNKLGEIEITYKLYENYLFCLLILFFMIWSIYLVSASQKNKNES